ncbi:MAG: hypothetical protein KBT03_03795 [Bacteroidales bacterium]|nr:hypothetical protein [Candidatus Scybalousia scybalohippi]
MEIFKLYGSIFVNTDEAKKSISDTAKDAKNLGDKLQKTGSNVEKVGKNITKGVTAIGGAFVGATTGMTAIAEKAAGAADQIDKMSQKIGVSREAYQELDFIMSQNGMDVDKLQGGMKKLVDTMQSAQSGGKGATEAFEKLNVAYQNADGTLRSQEELFYDTISALQGMTNEAERNALANDVFGKSASEMIPLLNSGAGSMEELRQKAHDLGLVMSDDTIDAGVKLTDTMDQLKRSFEQVGLQVGSELLPYVQEFAEYLIEHMPEIKEFVGEAAETFGWLAEKIFGLIEWFMKLEPAGQKVVVVIGLIISAIGPLVTIIGGVISLVGKLTAAWGVIAPFITGTVIPAFQAVVAVLTGPIIIAIGAVVAAIAVWVHNWEDIKEAARLAVEEIGFKLESLVEKVKTVFGKIKELVKLPHFKIEGDLSLNPPSVPKLSVDWYAKAMDNPMIMTSPTIFGVNSKGQPMGGGDAGSEVVSGTDTLLSMISSAVEGAISKDVIVSAIVEGLANSRLNMSAEISANSDRLFEAIRVKNAEFTNRNGRSALA